MTDKGMPNRRAAAGTGGRPSWHEFTAKFRGKWGKRQNTGEKTRMARKTACKSASEESTRYFLRVTRRGLRTERPRPAPLERLTEAAEETASRPATSESIAGGALAGRPQASRPKWCVGEEWQQADRSAQRSQHDGRIGIVLEARDRVGGRCGHTNLGNGRSTEWKANNS